MNSHIVILVPAYRCRATIAETLNSIQEQGPALQRIREVIIADDGSRDGSAEFARSLWHAETPLRILEREYNCGEYASVNNAVEQFPVDAEWFLIMHADNIAKPAWLETLLNRLDEVPDNVASVCASYDTFDESGKFAAGEDRKDAGIETIEGTIQSVAGTLKRGCWWHISSCAIRVSAFRKVAGLPKIMQLKGDWDFLLRILADGWSIEYIPATLMLYRDNPAGSSSLTFRRHMDISETMLVIGRFRWALSSSAILTLHARYAGYVARRLVRALTKLDVIRILWAFPAMALIFASCWTCMLDPAQPPAKSRP
jgi:GT2 family glycosyltransferase